MKRTITWRRGLSATVAITVAALCGPADGARQLAVTQLAKNASSYPDVPPLSTIGDTQVYEIEQVQQHVSRAKIKFSFGPILVNGNLGNDKQFCYYTIPSDLNNCADPKVQAIERPLPISPPPPVGQIPGSWVAAVFDSYVVTNPGPHHYYGQFPDVRVNALAFGAIPVSATVSLRQTSAHGYFNPIRLRLAYRQGVDPNYPSTWLAGYGAPDQTQDTFTEPMSDTNTLELRLSNVRVDNRPVDVGEQCSTVRPVELTLVQPGGYFTYNQDNDGTYIDGAAHKRGRPGAFLPVNNSPVLSALDGNVVIPAFSGCGSGGDNLDPILTSLISGRNNPISVLTNTVSIISSFYCNNIIYHRGPNPCNNPSDSPYATSQDRAAQRDKGSGVTPQARSVRLPDVPARVPVNK